MTVESQMVNALFLKNIPSLPPFGDKLRARTQRGMRDVWVPTAPQHLFILRVSFSSLDYGSSVSQSLYVYEIYVLE